MRCSTKRWSEYAAALLATLALGACAARGEAPRLGIDAANVVDDELNLAASFRPSATQLQALEQGVPLGLVVRVRDGAAAPRDIRLSLRYFPLSRRYQLHVDGGEDTSYALRGYLFAALENLRLPLPRGYCAASVRCRVELGFDYAALPGALRLPALLQADWRTRTAHADVGGPPA
jgi:hypothetical protein